MANVNIDDMINAKQQAQPGFKKGGQPVTPFKGRGQLTQDEYDAEYEALKDSGLDEYDRAAFADDAAWAYNHDSVEVAPNTYRNVPSPRPALDAYKNKQAALAADAADDRARAGAMDFQRIKSVPMNQIGVNKPREKVVTHSDGERGLIPHDDTEEIDPTGSYNGMRDRAVDFLTYDEDMADAKEKKSKSEKKIDKKEVKKSEDAPAADDEAEAKLRDIIGDDLFEMFKNNPERLGGMLKTVRNIAEDAPIIRSAGSDVDGIINGRMAARAANEPYRFAKASPEAGKEHKVSPVSRFDIITPEAAQLYKTNPDLFFGAIIHALGKAFSNAASPDDISTYDAVKALPKKLFGDIEMGSEDALPNVNLATDFNPEDDDYEMGSTIVNTLEDPSKGVSADNAISEEVDTSNPAYNTAYKKWKNVQGGLFDPSSRKGARVAGTAGAATNGGAAAPVSGANVQVPDF